MSQFPTIQKIILSENGNQSFQAQDTITIMLDQNEVGLLNGKDSYLRFNIKLNDGKGADPHPFKATLDRAGGGGFSVLSTVSIWNGNGNTLIEQLHDMPIWVGVKNYYDNSEGLENQRNLLEGLQEAGTTYQSQYFKNEAMGRVNFTSVECVLPMYQSGLLYGESACPIAALGGLMIKINLSGAKNAIVALNSNGFIIDRLGGGAALGATGTSAPNLPYNKAQVPVVAGEGTINQDLPVCFELGADIAGGGGPITQISVKGFGAAAVGIPTIPLNVRDNVLAPDGATVPADFPWVVGSVCGYVDDGGLTVNCGEITAITWVGTNFVVAFTATVTGVATATAANHCPCFVQLSNNLNTASYTLEDVEFIASVVQPDNRYYSAMMNSMKSSGGYSWDILSFSLYRNNLMKSIAQSQELIPTVEHRARGLLEAQIYPTTAWNTAYNQPISDYMRDYQYVMGQTNTPLLAVEVNREFDSSSNSWNATADEERLKALEASKVTVRSELHPSAAFVVGREVSKRGYSANLNTTEVRFNQSWGVVETVGGVNFQVMPQKNKILNTYVYHFRKITATPDNVRVEF